MSEPIKIGDLVMVVRGHGCTVSLCGGIPFRVTGFRHPRGGGYYCCVCNRDNSGPNVIGVKGFASKDAPIPITWLKRIDPLAEPESVETNESIPA